MTWYAEIILHVNDEKCWFESHGEMIWYMEVPVAGDLVSIEGGRS